MGRKVCGVGVSMIAFIVIFTVSIVMLGIGHRMVMNMHLAPFEKNNNLKNIENLLDETNRLVEDISAQTHYVPGSIEHTPEVKQELQQLRHDSQRLKTEMGTLQRSMSNADSHLAKCVAENTILLSHKEKCTSQVQLLHTALNASSSLSHSSYLPSSLSSSSSLSLSPWLVIGINTVSRSNSEPYLLQSLAALSSQLPSDPSDLLYNRVLVIIVNMQGTGHTRYDEAKKIYSPPHPLAACFRFIDYSPHLELADPLPGRTEKNDHGTANHPGYRVRKQTRHIVAVLHQALSVTKGSYYMFLEDDMQICAHGLLATQYMISKGSVYHPDWFAIRASYGMNGVVMRWRDLHGFAQYLLKHQTRRPPDHLVVEWYAGETEESKRVKNKRVNIGFRYNFFEHLGKISTLRPQQQSGFPGCYDELLEPTVFEVEAFNLQQCPRDDIWPCNNINKERKKHTVRLDWSVVKKTVAP
mmetsp:Transcript_30231/g.30716  ORF Transcript_30231/g.30716 Transcript_30231/m.30716 type:complete len:469 (+) Transcript_30231:81-1487(+)